MNNKTATVIGLFIVVLGVAAFAAVRSGNLLSFTSTECPDAPIVNINTCSVVHSYDELRSCLNADFTDDQLKEQGYHIKDGALWGPVCFEQGLGGN